MLPTEIPACILRPWREADIPDLVANANNRRVWRNLMDRFPHPYTREDAEHWLAFVHRPSSNVHFAIAVDDVAIGGIGATPGLDNFRRSAEFGYWLGEPYWGRGIATAAARATAAHVFATTDILRLQAPVFAWNPKSMRVLEKAGFTREGVLRQGLVKDGEITDCVLYARLRDEAVGNAP